MIFMIQKEVLKFNAALNNKHGFAFEHLEKDLSKKGLDVTSLIKKVKLFKIAIPSWALGTGGTRFGRFPAGGEPRNLQEKIEDIGLLHALTRSSGLISLHIPWDIPKNINTITAMMKQYDLSVDSVNSNTFQDQPTQKHSYKFGSLSHVEMAVREQAIEHNIQVIDYGEKLGANSLTLWLADGSCFPGQQHFCNTFDFTSESLKIIYKKMPLHWKMLVEYKPYEPNFYSMAIPDWGTAYLLAKTAGKNAKVLVDLGHHLPNTNIEQIVARTMHLNMLGGFHFNGSMYGDDDLTVGAIKPYQLFLIFNELVEAMGDKKIKNPEPAWTIDASHNVKDPLEDLLQSIEAILISYAQALIVDRKQLHEAQKNNDVTLSQEILQDAFRTDVRPLVREAILQKGGSLNPLGLYRQMDSREKLIKKRGKKSVATGL